ncbi:MAG TPA: 2-dehydropantoate 2-reductase [Gammaproteobacteria bacterium]|nr:2-dehydropantoate 2-reductase [Gammaproteobacteria bacterium]
MRIAVMGAGAIGCYVGGRLAYAGADVTFVARGEQLGALRSRGLTIIEPDRATTVSDVVATPEADEIGVVDVVLLCVKLFDSETALRACAPLLGAGSFVVTLQNGVDCVDVAAGVVGPDRVVGAAVFVVARVVEPGVVERTGDWARIEIAERSGDTTARCLELAALCRSAGIGCEIRDDLDQMLWSKFVLLAATSAMTALTRQAIGYVRSDPVALDVARCCVEEALAVARAKGIDLPADAQARALRQLGVEMAADAKASQLTDLEQGRPLELEHLSGAIHRLGRELGVPTPVHSTVYAALRPFRRGARDPGPEPGGRS